MFYSYFIQKTLIIFVHVVQYGFRQEVFSPDIQLFIVSLSTFFMLDLNDKSSLKHWIFLNAIFTYFQNFKDKLTEISFGRNRGIRVPTKLLILKFLQNINFYLLTAIFFEKHRNIKVSTKFLMQSGKLNIRAFVLTF